MDNDRGYPMNDMPDPKDAADFFAVFSTFWPLALVGALAGLARGFRRICREETWKERLLSIVITVIPSAIVSFIGVLCLPLVFDEPVSVNVQVGIAGLLGGLGTQTFNLFLRMIFKLSVVDLSDPEDIERLVRDRKGHAESCPFRKEHRELLTSEVETESDDN